MVSLFYITLIFAEYNIIPIFVICVMPGKKVISIHSNTVDSRYLEVKGAL